MGSPEKVSGQFENPMPLRGGGGQSFLAKNPQSGPSSTAENGAVGEQRGTEEKRDTL